MSSSIQPIITKDITQVAETIKLGRIVAFPTKTSYGLAVDALQGHALQRLRNLKKRPTEKTMSVFMSPDIWSTYLALTDIETKILQHTPLSLTLLVRPKRSMEHLSQDGLIGVRTIDHPMMHDLATACERPLTATSANVSGQAPCYDPACIQKTFPGKLDDSTYDLSLAHIIDGGQLQEAQPTTLASIEQGEIKIIRQGSVSASDLLSLL